MPQGPRTERVGEGFREILAEAIQKLKAKATTLTGVGYKGTHVASINLKPGQWTFFSPGGKKNYFIVAA